MLHQIRDLWRNRLKNQRSHNTFVMIGFFILCVGIAFGIVEVVQQYHFNATKQASIAYSDILEQIQEKEKKADLHQQADQLIKNYPKTIYANMTRLLLSEIAYQEGQMEQAKGYLNDIVNNPKETPLSHIARVRLARMLTDEKNYTEALSLLTKASSKGFEPLYETAKGDIYMAMGSIEEANQAYKMALQSMPQGASDAWLQIKQADIGGQG
ncbi:MAG: hypothetical protein RLZ35_603 [Pseudomonadota bacterium]|jgi:predicted negative regulator of RcsB-dependent stress response